jgi:hypothetical protein
VLVFSDGQLAAENLEAIARDRGGQVVRNAPNQPRNLAGNRKFPQPKCAARRLAAEDFYLGGLRREECAQRDAFGEFTRRRRQNHCLAGARIGNVACSSPI